MGFIVLIYKIEWSYYYSQRDSTQLRRNAHTEARATATRACHPPPPTFSSARAPAPFPPNLRYIHLGLVRISLRSFLRKKELSE